MALSRQGKLLRDDFIDRPSEKSSQPFFTKGKRHRLLAFSTEGTFNPLSVSDNTYYSTRDAAVVN
jgi:hypothetical protein